MKQIEERFAVHIDDYKHYDTEKLRKHFLIEKIFEDDQIHFVYTHYDRMMVGGAKPINKAVTLEPVDQQKAEHFLDRRELGAINIGGDGIVTVDGTDYELESKSAIYVGRGAKEVSFRSVDASNPAKFYLNSAPAHHAYPTKKVGMGDANVLELGSSDTCNERRVNQLLINGIIETCQLQMGMTELQPGSIWNTMPVHTHTRRMEAYFYFNVPEDQAVCHFMGPKDDTRHLWIHNEQAVLSPPWSMHSGVGTANYTFIWGMAGENLDYTDMDFHQPHELK
ncbi:MULTISPECIES: 5-dehydro-4-deoxy-D-glucuronate isomerase [Marinimicrobium]|jgi:4-deoxy-L-threo-5-hexosulose-uronate ketol-isomerase|uniref:4-deoxy-L-threo-5-hexosulose-uronate ketol-isomerase n=1 Tax=Marinimicrobium koreense TaxID=306545 RepID=A0A3N1NUJ3_9GAMM|nr:MULTISPECIES: 5-dehydro-4-deoxy-D-glucuronate isomerase [Marinimicrobium]MAN50712.1 5-dehydro-4-deoxy-D-glucuronate isomerase [Marinimicrobium sp.]ROQ18627.1 4-deoxy-L-threo-5-hexosulose-uronate ketol-isomerase [Marinimicrobium koreense]|tara:strand:- start:514 stop:1353 length:840 start_codon:yes stop_codon:yes gene_type:complete